MGFFSKLDAAVQHGWDVTPKEEAYLRQHPEYHKRWLRNRSVRTFVCLECGGVGTGIPKCCLAVEGE